MRTTVSDRLAAARAAAAGGGSAPELADQPGERTHARAREYSSPSVVGKTRGALTTIRSDIASAWVWSGQPPTLAELWADRIPDPEDVPGENGLLRAGWIVWNHLVLLPFAVIATLLWVLQHPARFGLAAAIAAPLIAIWIF